MGSSCNLVQLQKRYVERNVRQVGLQSQEIRLGEDTIRYWKGGKGPTLLLLHGFGADGTVAWESQILELAKHFHLIVPDLLWFGGSYSLKADFSVEHQARAIKNLLEHLQIQKTDVMGISYGGLVAMLLLAESPEQVGRAIFVASPGPVYNPQDYEELLERFQAKNPAEIILPRTHSGLKRLLDIAYRNPPWVPFFVQKDLIEYVQDNPEGQRTALLEDLVSNFTRVRHRLQIHPKHVLIVWGSDDTIFPLKIGKRLKDYFGAEAQLQVIEGARHAPNIEFNVEFNHIVLGFLK
ncbi:MAG: alpha/beta hydrolase [Myxococcaceae bacterium]|nr:alpha/beta hydrolase [Myxococcaceae bacterium]